MTDNSPSIPPATSVDSQPQKKQRFFRRNGSQRQMHRQESWDGKDRRRSDRRASQVNRGPMLESRAGRDRRRQGSFSARA